MSLNKNTTLKSHRDQETMTVKTMPSLCASVCLSVCTSLCLTVHSCPCLYICVPVCTSMCLSVYLCACLTPLCPTPPTFPVDFLICRLNCFFLNLLYLSRPCLCYFPETTKYTESTPFLSVNGLFPLVKNDQKWVQIPASFLTNLRVFYKVLF